MGMLAGCGFNSEPSGGNSGGSGVPQVLRVTSPLIESLDPHTVTNGFWILSRGLLEGLVTQNADATGVVAAAAEKWELAATGLAYTFTIRQGAKWSNGDPLTAHDFEKSFQRLLAPRSTATGSNTAGSSSYQVAAGIRGAAEFLSGALKDWSQVGIKANNDRELVLTLAATNPDFLLILTHPSMLPLHMDSVTKHPNAWQTPPNFVSNGPFAVDQYVPNSSMKLVPNEQYWDRKAVQLSRIDVLQVDVAAAAGTLTVPYESNETDVLQISDADVTRFQNDPTLKNHLRQVDTYMVSYLARLRSLHPAMDDVRVRKALALALNRDALAKVVPGGRPGTSLVHDKVKGWSSDLAARTDLAQAKQLLADAGYPAGKGLPTVRILSLSDSPLIDAIVDGWKTGLGINALHDRVDVGVYVKQRWAVQPADYIGFYAGTFAGLPTLNNYVSALWNPVEIQKFSMSSTAWQRYLDIEANASIDAAAKNQQLAALRTSEGSAGSNKMAELVTRAKAELNETSRERLFLEAAQLREAEHVFLPVMWMSQFFAVRPTVGKMNLRRYPDFFYFKDLTMSAA